jgi:hypothetical protein
LVNERRPRQNIRSQADDGIVRIGDTVRRLPRLLGYA